MPPKESAFEIFAHLHPHEAHAQDPDKFWSFFQTQCPGVSREQMIEMLGETKSDELPE